MRPAPPVQVTVQRYGVWRGVVRALAAAGALAITTWLLGRARPVDVAAWAIAAFAGVAIVVLALSSLRLAPCRLVWDGRTWRLVRGNDEPSAGTPQLAIDVGAWMLVRFEAPGRRAAWLPLQRAGLEADWHALRCALHSPRPVPRPDDPVA